MEFHWISLVIVSAAIHPYRELSLKHTHNPLASYLGVSVIWLIVATFQNVIMSQELQMPITSFPLVITSAAGLILYYYGTLTAMKLGQVSIYYPIVRSSPIAIVIFSWFFLDVKYTNLTVIGIIIISIGAIMLQKSRLSFLGNTKALFLAIMAMIGSAGYSISDAIAVQKIAPSVHLFYCYILVSFIFFFIFVFNNWNKKNTFNCLLHQWKLDQHKILSAGLISYSSYYLILVAFELGADAAAVSAVRQASIPISVLLAAYFLKENETFRRLGWASLIALGIIVLAGNDSSMLS